MAVSLGPNGLVGDGGGVEVSSGDLSSLGFSGSTDANINVALPSGYDWFRVFMTFRFAASGTDKATLYMQCFNGASQLGSVEGNSWLLRRGTAGSTNGAVQQIYNSSSNWTKIGDSIDAVNMNTLIFDVEGKSVTRPTIMWTGNYTHASQGSSLFFGSAHYSSAVRYTAIGINVDTLFCDYFKYRLVGYSA